MNTPILKAHPPGSKPSRRWPFHLAACFAALLLTTAPTAHAGLVLEVKPSDYDVGLKRWPITAGTMVGDYFQAPDWGAVSVATKIYLNNGLGYKAIDFSANASLLGGPLCPTSLGGGNPKTIEAWVFRPSTVDANSGMIFDLSRENFAVANRQFAFSNSDGGGGRALHTTGPGTVVETWNASFASRSNNWVHLVASYESGTLNLYVNGALDKSVSHTYDTESGGSMAIGMFRYGFEGTAHSVGSADGWTAWRGYLGSIRVYDSARTAQDVADDYALGVNYGEVPATVPNYTITASVTGGNGTIDPIGDASVAQNTDKTYLMLPDSGYMVDTVTIDGGPVVLPYPGTSYKFTNVTVGHSINVTFKADPNWDILFSLNTDSLTGAEGSRITSWTCAVPVGASMPAFNTFNNGLPELGPIVQTIDGVKWEQNTRANYSEVPPPTVHTRQDGFQLGGDYTTPIVVNGVSVVTVIKPARKAISDGWNSLVDVFYGKLVLGIHNDTGNLLVKRNGATFNGPAIPDGQKTVLSLVVQTGGPFKVYANGIEVMNETTTSDMSTLTPGSANHEKRIYVGRGWDSWTVFNGNIGDTALYKRAIDDTTRTALESALGAKFGITVAGPPVATTIRGTVTDAGVGVENVLVTTTPGGLTGTTIGNGDYTITGATSGISYTLTASNLPYGKATDTTPAAFVATEAPNMGKDFTLKSIPVATTISGRVIDAGAGTRVTATPGGQYADTDVNGDYTITGATSGTAYTLTATSLPVGKLVDTAPATFTASVAANTGKDFTLKDDPYYDPTLVFALNTNDLSGIEEGARIMTWGGMPAKETFNNDLPMLGPIVETLGSVKWEQNTRANYSDATPPTIHTRQDGFQFGSAFAAPIAASGASIVTVVRPVRKAIIDDWNAVVSVFHTNLVLGVRNDTGLLTVFRNGSRFYGPAIPDGQKTILSLVIQQTGPFKVYANGVEVMNETSTSDMSALTPGSLGHEKYIYIGRGFDAWSVYNGNIADTYLYKTAIDDTRRAGLEASLATKFGIGGEPAGPYANWLALFTFAPDADKSATGDPDGDGLSNQQEFAFGLDPTKGSSVSPIVVPLDKAAGTFSYTRTANSGLIYTVWTSIGLNDWGTVPAPATQVPRVPVVGGVETVDVTLTDYVPPPGGKLFVRVAAQ